MPAILAFGCVLGVWVFGVLKGVAVRSPLRSRAENHLRLVQNRWDRRGMVSSLRADATTSTMLADVCPSPREGEWLPFLTKIEILIS